jgi:hypothetical protein
VLTIVGVAPAERGAVDADAGRETVGPSERGVVAARARDGAVARHARVEEESTAELDTRRGRLVLVRSRRFAQQPDAVLLRGRGDLVGGAGVRATPRQRNEDSCRSEEPGRRRPSDHGAFPGETHFSVLTHLETLMRMNGRRVLHARFSVTRRKLSWVKAHADFSNTRGW